MKKSKKSKTPKRSKAKEPAVIDLVTAMTKLVERLEILERKMDQVLGRVSNLPSELRQASQGAQRSDQGSAQPPQAPRPRVLYQTTCADCLKSCEVPFKPSGDRPVYCPECWAIRKAGHKPKDIASKINVPGHLKQRGTVSTKDIEAASSPKVDFTSKKKAKPAKKTKTKKKKK